MINIPLTATALICGATKATDVFPLRLTLDEVQGLFRIYAKELHPDLGGDPALMAKLTRFYAERTKTPIAAPVTLGNWVVTAPISRGGVADLYNARRAKDGQAAVIKIARHPRDNDLLKREHDTLKVIEREKGGDNFKRYLPVALDTFMASGRRANVISAAEDCYSLEYIRKQYPSGIDFRHIVWMMNRLLSVIGYLHVLDLVHGAVLPQHLMYRPSDHGLVLVDFSCAVNVTLGGAIPYVVKRYTDLYPLEVTTRKGWCCLSTDIFMAFASLRSAAADVPFRFRALFDYALLESPRSRPQDPWDLQDRWLGLASDEYGPPGWVPFSVPVN